MGHENGGKQRLAKRRHVQGMLDETDPLRVLGVMGVSGSYGLVFPVCHFNIDQTL